MWFGVFGFGMLLRFIPHVRFLVFVVVATVVVMRRGRGRREKC